MAFAGKLLALDLAGVVGWCVGRPGEALRFGHEDVTGMSRGHLGGNLDAWLRDFIKVHSPDVIVYEAPFMRGLEATRVTFGIAMVAEVVAFDFSRPISESNIQEVRKRVIGRGQFPSGTAKSVVIAWCREHGHQVATDDEADAVVLWHSAMILRGIRFDWHEAIGQKPRWTVPA